VPCGDLLAFKNVVVMNDEAHHCYSERVGDGEDEKLTAEDRQEASLLLATLHTSSKNQARRARVPGE
jgi:hypothetical protein